MDVVLVVGAGVVVEAEVVDALSGVVVVVVAAGPGGGKHGTGCCSGNTFSKGPGLPSLFSSDLIPLVRCSSLGISVFCVANSTDYT